MNHYRNALWMQDAGVNVVVFALENSPLANAAQKSKLKVVFIKKHHKYYDYIAAFKLARLLKEDLITHLFIRDTRDMSIAGLAKLFLKNQLHISYFMEMQLGIRKKDLLHTIRFAQLDNWFCPLEYLKQQVVEKTRFPADKIHVVPSGLDMFQFQEVLDKTEARKMLNLPSDLILFGLIGRFDPQKGQLLTLQAFEALKKATVGLVFLGEKTKNESDEYFIKIEEYIEKYNLKDRVFIRPFRQDISTFFCAIDATIMASKSETFGMVTIESMACGVPVIGSASGGTVELLKNGEIGYLFMPENQELLKLAMQEYLNNPKLFNKEKLRFEAEKYNRQKITEQIISLCLNNK